MPDWLDAWWWVAPAALVVCGVILARRGTTWAASLARYATAVGEDRQAGTPPARPPGAFGRLQAAVVRALAYERERTEIARAEQRRLEGVLGGMVEGVLVIDAEGTVLLSNHRAEELLELPPGEVYAGRPLIELTRHPDLHRLVHWAANAREGDGSTALEIGFDGTSPQILQVTATPIDAGPDGERSFILVFHDISHMKRLERMRRDFVANVSHELRTPLAAIAGYTETLLGGAVDTPETARRFLGIIERHTDRLGRLVNDLLTLSDLELGRTALRRGAVPADQVIESTFEVLRDRAAQQELRLEREIPADAPVLDADQDRVEQALLNLVDNAIKYTPRGGRVVVRTRIVPPDAVPESRRGDGLEYGELSVEDTGVGVPPEDLPRLTERFYRVDKARSRELGGTGLGLAIVKHIIQAHGGWLSIESEVGKGTTVRVAIPLHDDRRATGVTALAAGDERF